MSQRDFMQAMDAEMIAAFADFGMADAATWTSEAGTETGACTVLVDREAQFFGEHGEVAGRRIAVTVFLADVAAPAEGDTITLTDTAEVFTLDQLVERDESKTRWVVTHG